jgi:hypothetical protein
MIFFLNIDFLNNLAGYILSTAAGDSSKICPKWIFQGCLASTSLASSFSGDLNGREKAHLQPAIFNHSHLTQNRYHIASPPCSRKAFDRPLYGRHEHRSPHMTLVGRSRTMHLRGRQLSECVVGLLTLEGPVQIYG